MGAGRREGKGREEGKLGTDTEIGGERGRDERGRGGVRNGKVKHKEVRRQ
jgi:hypothetical protein